MATKKKKDRKRADREFTFALFEIAAQAAGMSMVAWYPPDLNAKKFGRHLKDFSKSWRQR